ncbi:MAG: RNA 3'-phosphate cyclase [Planctomycetes bacterium]|nr:RNA 3'-phosphate cyclase [Planctomycetota bacterium]
MSKSLIVIDGAQGEGGGQVLRTSLALALITGKPFRLRNIRARRSRPGLQAQHLMSVRAAAEIGAAKLRGASLGSVDLTFEPGQVTAGDYHFKIGTAGATSLVLHTIYLPLALSGGASTVIIEGGTHVKASPCFHFLARTWTAYLKAIGINGDVTLQRVGFYPRGGGAITARIEPCECPLPFFGLTAAPITTASIVTVLAGLPSQIGDRLRQRAANRLGNLGLEVETRMETHTGGPGCILGIELPTAPAPTFLFALGEKGTPAEAVADEAASIVADFLRADPLGVDEHSADHLLLPLSLAEGASEFRVASLSSHLLTNADVIGHFLERSITFEGTQGEPGTVRFG